MPPVTDARSTGEDSIAGNHESDDMKPAGCINYSESPQGETQTSKPQPQGRESPEQSAMTRGNTRAGASGIHERKNIREQH